jgi:thiamine-monophosphate kinase
VTSEFEVLAGLVDRLGASPPDEVWAGDDAAVLGDLVVTVDPLVDGVHLDRSLMTLADGGWKVVARNVSDVAAMGAQPWRAVVSVVGASAAEVREVYDGILEATEHWGVAVAGGDLASGATLVVTITMLGRLEGAAAVLRSGARPGDDLWLATPDGIGLGRGAAGLRLLRAGELEGASQAWLRRPVPSVPAGLAARAAGARAMIDISDGLVGDLCHLADASAVGFTITDVPVAEGATREEALYGGDEYALVFAAPPTAAVESVFAASGLPRPRRIGVCTREVSDRTVDGAPFPASTGWQHDL